MSGLVIEAGKTERHYWADIWKYRKLFFFLSWRDILVRYKQTVIGVLWAVTGVSSFFYWPGFLASPALVFLIAASGVWYFRKTERAFADAI
jgi:ABC-type polysaccharide/polyol phosphate export permease